MRIRHLLAYSLCFLLPAATALGGVRRVTFTEDASVFRNPGQGWSSMGGESSLRRMEKLVNVGAIYARLTWAQLEPREGVYDWKPLDDLLACGVGFRSPSASCA